MCVGYTGQRTGGEGPGQWFGKKPKKGSKMGSEEPFMKNYGFEVFPAADGESGKTSEQQCNSALGRWHRRGADAE